MAYLQLKPSSLIHNFKHLNQRLEHYGKDWGIVTKMLCGHPAFLREVLKLHPKAVFDSRLSNLAAVKRIDPEIETVYIKPVPRRSIAKLLDCADVSFNTEIATIEAINALAGEREKRHQIVIMIEMGDLREGVLREDLVEFYSRVFALQHVDVRGIGTNLNCMNGVMPSNDKLIQLSLYQQLLEARFDRRIPWVTAGTSVTLPLLSKHQVPKGVNHFRIGETLYFGKNLFSGKTFHNMKDDVFRFKAEVIEIQEKPMVAEGIQGQNVAGDTPVFHVDDMGKTSHRAILDVGLLDIAVENLQPAQEGHRIIGASSDMLVLDVGDSGRRIKVGDFVAFKVDYMGVLSLMNSRYIDKRIAS